MKKDWIDPVACTLFSATGIVILIKGEMYGWLFIASAVHYLILTLLNLKEK